jgi:IS30 family transposase
MRHFKHLSHTDRLRIEAMTRQKLPAAEIARTVRAHVSTVYRELKRGVYERLNPDLTTAAAYSPDIAHERYRRNLAAKGPGLKIGKDHRLARHIEHKIAIEKYSPAAVLGEIKARGLSFDTSVCASTLYSYIDGGVFLSITNKSLPVKGVRPRTYKRVRAAARPPRGESIEKRPDVIGARETFGHWEMDCVQGKKQTKRTLLVLTERLTRHELVRPIPEKTAPCVVAALDALERRFGKAFRDLFRSVTVDNGSEFSDCAGMERSAFGAGPPRTKLYYCHPYHAAERGSNENQNRLIRRHFPKGTSFEGVPDADIERVQDWINNYPRKIFGWRTAADLFREHTGHLRI